MVLRLLLDEHVSRVIPEQVLVRRPQMNIVSLVAWEGGAYLATADDVMLSAAREQGLTLVTYDQRTIAPLIKSWAAQGTSHGGIAFIDHRTLAPNDIGGLVRALCQLWDAQWQMDWTNRVVYLTR